MTFLTQGIVKSSVFFKSCCSGEPLDKGTRKVPGDEAVALQKSPPGPPVCPPGPTAPGRKTNSSRKQKTLCLCAVNYDLTLHRGAVIQALVMDSFYFNSPSTLLSFIKLSQAGDGLIRAGPGGGCERLSRTPSSWIFLNISVV